MNHNISVDHFKWSFHCYLLQVEKIDPSCWKRPRIWVRLGRHGHYVFIFSRNPEHSARRRRRRGVVYDGRLRGSGCQLLKYLLFDVPFPIFIFSCPRMRSMISSLTGSVAVVMQIPALNENTNDRKYREEVTNLM